MTTMQVETFECSEVAAEPIEASQEAIALCEQLGLEGQLALCRKGETPAEAKRSPYREMTAEEVFTYGMLCPSIVKLSAYRRGPIPLRVLQVAAHFQSLETGLHLYVMDKESHAVKDPVLVAVGETHVHRLYSWHKCVILARWGEVLETFSTLLKQALKLKREELAQKVAGVARKVEFATDDEIIRFNENIA